jgi:hypothetical protein
LRLPDAVLASVVLEPVVASGMHSLARLLEEIRPPAMGVTHDQNLETGTLGLRA